tara:strand:- start:277 stop:519 length:243 start_codon:yes stop_codon:yes gene_type:complete
MAELRELSNRTIRGYHFAYDECNEMFECRGRIMYDDEHDEMPEPKLMDAAYVLKQMLENEGLKSTVDHSEKGWVEVSISN